MVGGGGNSRGGGSGVVVVGAEGREGGEVKKE